MVEHYDGPVVGTHPLFGPEPKPEDALRVAVMHFVAEAFLLSHKLVVREPQAVLDAFGQHFDNTGELPPTFHHWLVEAARLYPHVEYETDNHLTKDMVAEQLERARFFVNLGLEELAGSPR